MRFIFSYVKKYMNTVTLGLTIKIIGTIMDLIIPLIFAYITKSVIQKGDLNQVLIYGVIMLICSILAVVFNIIANRMAAKVAKDTTFEIRRDLFTKITNLEQADIDRFSVPTLVSRMTTDTYNINSMVGMIQRMGVRAPILLIGGMLMTLTLDPTLTLVMLCSLPIIFGIIYFVSKIGVPLYAKVQIAIDRLILVVRENISGAKVIRALDKTDYEKNRFDGANVTCSNQDRKASKVMATLNPLLNIIMNIGLIVVLYLGARRIFHAKTDQASVIAFMTYFTIILNAMLSVTRIFINVSKAAASAKRIVEIMDIEESMKIEEKEGTEHYIEFNGVDFSYNKKVNNLSNINFTLEKGQSLGIIGSTGSGKTTIVNLLMRFYDPDNGNIYVDGRNIKSIPKKELNEKFGVVFQQDTLFSETLLENIDFGRNIDFNQIESATKNAMAYDFITANEGFSKVLSARGSNLSGGQRQRVLLSRAMASNPEILILDDSSSALDYKTDANLRKSIRENYSGTTVVIVASRISSIAHCDKIIVLEDGNINAIGTHEELLKNSDLYKMIKKSQMGGEE